MKDLLEPVTRMLQFLQEFVPLGEQSRIAFSNGLVVHLQVLAVSLVDH